MYRAISRIAIVSALVFPYSAGVLAQSGLSGLVPESILEQAGLQTAEGRRAVQQYLTGDRPSPQVVAARAALAIRDLPGSGMYADPTALVAAADNIAAAAQPVLCPPKVMHAFVPNDFALPSGAVGYDFGPPESATMPGFEPVRPNDSRLAGATTRGVHRPGENGLISDGIIGVRRFTTPMENGVHRILLITDDGGDEATLRSPLGSGLIVNGKRIELGDHPSSDWLPEAVLRNPQSPLAVTETEVNGVPFVSQRAGALMVEAEITNGRLEIELQQPGGSGRNSYLVGLVAAPIAQGDVVGRYFDASQAVLDTDQCLALEELIDGAVAELVEAVAPAAGPQEVQDLPDAVFEDGEAASPA